MKSTILIIDNDPIILKLYASAFSEDFNVLAITKSRLCIETIKANPGLILVIMDYQTSNIDVPSVMNWIKKTGLGYPLCCLLN